MNTEGFQTIWNAILATGVPHVKLIPEFSEDKEDHSNDNTNNNTINFTGLSTNMSLKRLDIKGICMSQHSWRNMFLSIQGNTGLEKLKIHLGYHRNILNNTEIVPYFTEMLQKNNTLIDVQANAINDHHVQNEFHNVITIKTKLNRKWNQYLMKRNEEGA